MALYRDQEPSKESVFPDKLWQIILYGDEKDKTEHEEENTDFLEMKIWWKNHV